MNPALMALLALPLNADEWDIPYQREAFEYQEVGDLIFRRLTWRGLWADYHNSIYIGLFYSPRVASTTFFLTS